MYESITAICVQRFDDSRGFAFYITYRILLRSSSLREPRYPLLRVVYYGCFILLLLRGEEFSRLMLFVCIGGGGWGGIILLLRFEIRKGLKVFFFIPRGDSKTLTQGGWLVFDSLHTLEKRVLQRHLALNQSIIKCNDPSAGSPTDTLLRLLLPLNDTIWGGSNSQPLQAEKTPHYSLNHSIGNSDGRCVQRPETYSMPVDDRRLLGIPRSRRIITIVYPQHYSISKISQSSRIRGSLAEEGCPPPTKRTKNLLLL